MTADLGFGNKPRGARYSASRDDLPVRGADAGGAVLEILEGRERVWSVAGHVVEVPHSHPVPHYVLGYAAETVEPPGPWRIRLRLVGGDFDLTLGLDGGVRLDPQSPSVPVVWEWLLPAGSLRTPSPPQREVASTDATQQLVPSRDRAERGPYGAADQCREPAWHRATVPGKFCAACGKLRPEGDMFVGAHPVAGTSTWAALLSGADMGTEMPATGRVVGVCRATPAGLKAMKTFIGTHGAGRFRAVLVVADAPGRMISQAAREVKVLAAGVPVVVVPWVVKLRGVETPASVAAMVRRPVTRIQNQLERAARVVPREFRARNDHHNRRKA